MLISKPLDRVLARLAGHGPVPCAAVIIGGFPAAGPGRRVQGFKPVLNSTKFGSGIYHKVC